MVQMYLFSGACVLLDTLESGVPNAIRVFEELRRNGHEPIGIRLDSGDQAYLSIQAAKQMDEAGFTDTAIVLSSDLDELVIWQILTQISQEGPCRIGLYSSPLITASQTKMKLVSSEARPAVEEVVANKLFKVLGLPLLILGSICLVFLTLGRWFKRISGEALDLYLRTADAQFYPLLKARKFLQYQDDLKTLYRSILRPEYRLRWR